MEGFRGVSGGASPPYTRGPYTMDQHVTFTGGVAGANAHANVWYVDGDTGSAANDGKGWSTAFALIQTAVTAASSGDIIFVEGLAVASGGTDPSSYTENIVIPAATDGLSIIGVSRGRTQGGLPQLKVGATTTQAIITVRAPNCLLMNLGVNGAGATGGGILLDDDGSTKTAFGTSIIGCHFKNCKGTTATNAATGGAIMWSANGGAWQSLIKGCRFYKNVGGIVMKGTAISVPQDIVIEDCEFAGKSTSVDCDIYVAADGIDGLTIRNCSFAQLPAIGSGTNVRYIILPTGTVGVISGCTFGCQTAATGTELTFKASGTGASFPTTVHIVNSWGQSITVGESGEINIA